LCAIERANALDTSMIDYNSLIFLGRGTGAIDQACVVRYADEDDGSLRHTMEEA
jgi:hypothetical protein